MTLAQASVGAAAGWPTMGTILMAAEPTRQGAATRPQPVRGRIAASRAIGRVRFVSFMNRYFGRVLADANTRLHVF